MIDFYGGGGEVDIKLYSAAQPKHDVPTFPPHGGGGGGGGGGHHNGSAAAAPRTQLGAAVAAPPPASNAAARARWLVTNSMWTAVSTVSVHLPGKPWANVRSMADGTGQNSTGLPVMYLPTPDPSSIDIAADAHCALSFSEAALPQRLTGKGTCGGMDSEDPTCARLVLSGKLRALSTQAEINQAMIDLGERHPKAPWLAQGGAHTGGKYFQLDLASLSFLDTYGGFAKLSVADYLAGK